jgi:hypothetical protein
MNWLKFEPTKLAQPARALRVWSVVRSWFDDPEAAELKKYVQLISTAADAAETSATTAK